MSYLDIQESFTQGTHPVPLGTKDLCQISRAHRTRSPAAQPAASLPCQEPQREPRLGWVTLGGFTTCEPFPFCDPPAPTTFVSPLLTVPTLGALAQGEGTRSLLQPVQQDGNKSPPTEGRKRRRKAARGC